MRIFGREIVLKKTERQGAKGLPIFRWHTFSGERLDFAKSDLLDCFKKISNRLGNAEFLAKVEFIATKQIFDFLKANRLQIIQRLFFDSFVIVDCQKLEIVQKAQKTVSLDKLLFNLKENEVVVCSETMLATGNSDFFYLKDKLTFLNSLNSSDFNLIENYGAMGIVSPEQGDIQGQELDDEAIADLQTRYQKSYGISVGKWSLMFVPRPTKYTKIDLPIAQLQLSEKRLYVLKSLYSFFDIPKELSVYFENTKYANRNEAELDFYSNTITTWANIFLKIAYEIYNKKRKTESYLLENEFWFDFRGVLALEDKKLVQRQSAREEFKFWKEVLTSMPEHSETANKRINDLIESL